ncbi:DUF6056 family protein [Helicobacter burdigaliensis]|uniref:DUF6056 family protein n=1 Tax=Helicobacter burdigaliensis TaxID=2315334 RepID=UPI000EF66868|nr:DUF6056 family protein [Helicobacter burdigaliensis]
MRAFIFFLGLYIYLFVLNLLVLPQSDDIGFWLNADKAQLLGTYLGSNARIGEILYSGIFAKYSFEVWYDVLNALVGTIFFYVLFVLYFARKPKDRLDYYMLFLVIGLVVMFSAFGSTFLWGAGSFNYLWGISFIIYFLLPFRVFYQRIYEGNLPREQSILMNLFFGIGLFLLGILAGMASEHVGLIVCIGLFISLVYLFYGKLKIPLWQYFGTMGFWCGWLLLYFAPGQQARALNSANYLSFGEFFELGFLGMVSRIYTTFNGYFNYSFLAFLLLFLLIFMVIKGIKIKAYHYIGLLFGMVVIGVIMKHVGAFVIYLFVLYLVYKLYKMDKKKYLLVLGLYGIYLFMGLVIFQVGELPKRAHLGTSLFLYAIIVYLVLDLYAKSMQKEKYFKAIKLICGGFCLVCFINYSYGLYQWSVVYKEAKNAKEKGEEELNIEARWFKRYLPFDDWNRPNIEPNWVNDLYARYFGFKKFNLK